MPGKSFQKVISEAEVLNGALKPHLVEMPFLAADSGDLDDLITETKVLNQEQQAVTARLRELVRLRKEAEHRSNDLRSRIAAHLRGQLGFTSEGLIAYGIPPRRPPRNPPAEPPPVGEVLPVSPEVGDGAPEDSTSKP